MSKKVEYTQNHTYYMFNKSKKDSIIMRNLSLKSHNSAFSKEKKSKSIIILGPNSRKSTR